MSQTITNHYASDGIATRLLTALRAARGAAVAVTPDELAPLDHFHSRGLPATRDLAAALDPQPADRVLDIGCGIGGPARWIAAKFGCHVTGIDLTAEFIAAAKELSLACGLEHRTRFEHASALELPFADQSFDRAYSHNVSMNIADKLAFYREALRVLKPGGRAVFADLGQGPGGAPHYPVPWASDPSASFLATPDQTRAALTTAGFTIEKLEDSSERVMAATIEQIGKLETEGFPPLHLHVLMGARMKDYVLNSMRSQRDGRVLTMVAVVKRPNTPA